MMMGNFVKLLLIFFTIINKISAESILFMANDTNMIYYVYSYTIARTDGIKTEIKNHQTGLWVEIVDPLLWKRVQQEGSQVTKEEAEQIYQQFHQQIDSSD